MKISGHLVCCWICCFVFLSVPRSSYGQISVSGFTPNMTGIASIDRAVPMFSHPILTLGSVVLLNGKPSFLKIIFPLRRIVLQLPSNANKKTAIMFDTEDDISENISVHIDYLSGGWYHGSFASHDSTINFIYQVGGKDESAAEAFKRLWSNPNVN